MNFAERRECYPGRVCSCLARIEWLASGTRKAIFSEFSRAYSKLMVASNSEFLPQIQVLEKRGFPVMVALDLLYELELSRVCAVRALQYLFSA